MSKRALIIDHDAILRNLVCELLETRGYSCDQAANSTEATRMLESEHYDLLMLDLMLPGTNGFDVLRYIRENFPEKSDHTIVLTDSDPKFVAALPSQGWCAVLVKPVSAGELYRVVDLCIGGKHASGVYN